jgi:hypothetical protein
MQYFVKEIHGIDGAVKLDDACGHLCAPVVGAAMLCKAFLLYGFLNPSGWTPSLLAKPQRLPYNGLNQGEDDHLYTLES